MFFHKTKDIITLFHKAGSPASVRAVAVLKQASANASQSATEDQASDHSHQTHAQRSEFDLNVTEDPPTTDQLQTILEYVGQNKIKSVVSGANTVTEALKTFKESPDSFKRPVVVDWNNGKAVATESESEILKMVNELSK
ncbi:thioredoxin-like protein [Pseudomassariella vexata]|uniref:Thioredoxin-like protein n=1 Tax=Pseudomassariella vexata TaxID=1141098 RepID=A0A1Y2DMR5_9PEZI|nr:thioredoxin-like protein [Pseudomassariella vexata]ORY60540.1 thioredoxin-like protein [Pseudomassariella vexata]